MFERLPADRQASKYEVKMEVMRCLPDRPAGIVSLRSLLALALVLLRLNDYQHYQLCHGRNIVGNYNPSDSLQGSACAVHADRRCAVCADRWAGIARFCLKSLLALVTLRLIVVVLFGRFGLPNFSL